KNVGSRTKNHRTLPGNKNGFQTIPFSPVIPGSRHRSASGAVGQVMALLATEGDLLARSAHDHAPPWANCEARV
ncbi:hypothetical protein, partial [Aeromonas aquatica]|uniref:hypothetical protein n=1 Tax=Aeromonas aquatica TaxID=558964 RepID=UPI00286EF50B